jgi:hypothetical protein
MSRLDNYRSALLAAFPDVADAKLGAVLEKGGPDFVSFVIDHGLGPLWHERTGRDEFHECRLAAEAIYLAQEHELQEIDAVLEGEGIKYAVIKGAASRLLLYENPAVRTCYDIDLLVCPEDRIRASAALVDAGFTATAESRSISRELVLSRGSVDIDLHWGLLREGRLRNDCTADMLDRRRRIDDVWMLNAEDSVFLLLVHPAFAKHLAGWGMGMHRIVDIIIWLRTQSFDWHVVRSLLEQNGVRTAAWATLRWVELLILQQPLSRLGEIAADVCPSRLRSSWLDFWLRNDLSERTSGKHWTRLLGFSSFLHDTPRDAMRALAGRYRARRRSDSDIEAFRELLN